MSVIDGFVRTFSLNWRMFPFHALVAALLIKCFLILFYATLLYWLIRAVKKLAGNRIGVRAGYYLWYTLLLAVPISGFSFNGVVKVPMLELFQNFGSRYYEYMTATVVVALWVLVVLYRLEAHIITNSRLEYAVSLMDSADVDDLKDRAAAAFGLRVKWIKVAEAEWISSPITYGVFRKTILLPMGFRERYSEEELYLLLLHEMAHIKNGDMAKLYFISLANCLFLVPPGFLKSFKRDSEILCDNRVVGVSSTNVYGYTDLLIRESTRKAAPIKGIAFSDSFLAVKSRVNALEQFSPVKHRFAVFSAVILALLLAAVYHAYTTPDAWYRESYPEIPEFDMYVIFEGEDQEALMLEYGYYIEGGGAMPLVKDDRPRLAALAGTYDFPGDGQLRLDVFALREILSGMDKDGRKAEFVRVIHRTHEFGSDFRPTGSSYLNIFSESFNMGEDGKTERYHELNITSNNKYIHKLVAYWL